MVAMAQSLQLEDSYDAEQKSTVSPAGHLSLSQCFVQEALEFPHIYLRPDIALEQTESQGNLYNGKLKWGNNIKAQEQNHPGYFGKVGMSYFHRFRNKFHCPVVNVEYLWSLVPQEAREKVAGSGAAPVVDVMHRKGIF
ncbi:hypothetical protein RJ639_030383 [Escallonia herrerae]|uniref:Uncharacterized protein n=1 Tax=Escallonia herrerae TaxID=1293975 RepID=A0AA89BH23_9ASTE|nr:hypothetical protein RJ639_030383 [Escallonia herrerae]